MTQPRNEQGRFATDREETRSAKLSLRIEPSTLERIQAVPEWQEKVRLLLYQWVEEQGES